MKKYALYFALLIFVIAAIEAMAYLTHLFYFGAALDKEAVSKQRQMLLAAIHHSPTSEKSYYRNFITHPYFGIAPNPHYPPSQVHHAEDFGFFNTSDEVFEEKRDKSKLYVGIFGGSVACQLYLFPGFVEAFKQYPQFSRKSFHIVPFCMGGLKQPQQIQQLSLFLTLGGHLDFIVNIDGYNELALPALENISKGVSWFYPRSWHFIAVTSEENRDPLEKLDRLQSLKANIANLTNLIGSTIFGNVVWKFSDQILNSKMQAETARIQSIYEHLGDEKGVTRDGRVSMGIGRALTDYGEYFKASTLMWFRASLQMQKLARTSGAKYFHILQPNHYFKGSFDLSGENQQFYFGEHQARKIIESGYPYLRFAGVKLRRLGVQFHDLTLEFQNTKTAVLMDNCCHFNSDGLETLTKKIVSVVTDNWSKPERETQHVTHFDFPFIELKRFALTEDYTNRALEPLESFPIRSASNP